MKSCCLRRVGSNPKKYRVIPLKSQTQVTVGRSLDAVVCIMSRMISRVHAIFEENKDLQWTVKDCNSLNGLFLNGLRVKPSECYLLVEGDMVQFGVRPHPTEPPEFVYRFCIEYISSGSHQQDNVTENIQKRQWQDSTTEHTKAPSSENEMLSPPAKRACNMPSTEPTSPSVLMQKKIDEQERLSNQKLQEAEARVQSLQRLLEQKAQNEVRLKIELRHKEDQMKRELEVQKAKMEQEKKELEEELKSKLAEQLKEKEVMLIQQLDSQRTYLIEERNRVERQLKTELEQTIAKKNQTLAMKLRQEKEKLDKVILTKECEQKMLESELRKTKEEVTIHKEEERLQIKDNILQCFTDLMETELTCSICQEMFIQAVTLSCSHSFCQSCINEWKSKQQGKKKECPMCRAEYTSLTRALVIDSYIDKMVEHLSEDLQKSRNELVHQREADLEKCKSKSKSPKKATAHVTTQVTASSQPGPSGITTRSMHSTANNTITVDDDTTDDDEEEEASDTWYTDEELDSDSEGMMYAAESSYVSGVDGAYYGGYGACYRCGNRGHWATGCPFY